MQFPLDQRHQICHPVSISGSKRACAFMDQAYSADDFAGTITQWVQGIKPHFEMIDPAQRGVKWRRLLWHHLQACTQRQLCAELMRLRWVDRRRTRISFGMQADHACRHTEQVFPQPLDTRNSVKNILVPLPARIKCRTVAVNARR